MKKDFPEWMSKERKDHIFYELVTVCFLFMHSVQLFVKSHISLQHQHEYCRGRTWRPVPMNPKEILVSPSSAWLSPKYKT